MQQAAGGHFQGSHCGVNVSRGTAVGVDHATPGGKDFDQRLAGEPAHEIDIVNSGVDEVAAGCLELAQRRWCRLTAGAHDKVELSEFASAYDRLQLLIVGIEATIESEHERHGIPVEYIETLTHPFE